MKKCIALLLILFLAFPFIGLADTVPESFYVGTWVLTQNLNGDVGITVTYLHLMEDHTVYYCLQEICNDGSDDFHRSGFKSWSCSGNKIVVQIGENAKLYLKVKDRNTLQDDQYRPQDLYIRVGSELPASESADGEAAAAVSPADLWGKWSHYWDARDLNNLLGSRGMSFDIRSYDLYLMEDGKAYLDTVTCKNGVMSSGGVLLPGSWTIVEDKITLVLGSDVYFAWLDASGRLFVQMTDSMALIYEKVSNYNYEEGML